MVERDLAKVDVAGSSPVSRSILFCMELQNQSFDVFQRFSGILRLLESLEMREGSSLLDVGGYPGALADYIKESFRGAKVITLDRPVCPRESYISGSAESLPFADSSFDAVLSSDTIEHLAPEQRISSIKETLRVSKRWVVIGAPFKNPCVDFAEEKISTLYQKCFKKSHPWLSEHITNRLPERRFIQKMLEDSSAAVGVYPNGSVASWFILEAVQILLDSFPMLSRFRQDLSRSFNAFWAASDDKEPAYRHILVADKTGELPSALPPPPPATSEKEEDVLKRLESLYSLADEISGEILSLLSDPAASTKMLTEQYIRQMEEVLAFQEKEQEKLNQEVADQKKYLDRLNSSYLFRLLRKFGLF